MIELPKSPNLAWPCSEISTFTCSKRCVGLISEASGIMMNWRLLYHHAPGSPVNCYALDLLLRTLAISISWRYSTAIAIWLHFKNVNVHMVANKNALTSLRLLASGLASRYWGIVPLIIQGDTIAIWFRNPVIPSNSIMLRCLHLDHACSSLATSYYKGMA